jgi:hypothetical protein
MQNPVCLVPSRLSSVFQVTRRFGLCLLLGALILATGCGGGSKALSNSVSGKVTVVPGDQIVSGSVVFVYSDKEKVTPIGPDGTYTMADPPAGQVKILVKGDQSRLAAPPPMKGGPEMPSMGGGSQAVPPPIRYATAQGSDLTYEVKPGKHTHNIELKK